MGLADLALDTVASPLNLYTKPMTNKCYWRQNLGHRSNEYPDRKLILVEEGEEEADREVGKWNEEDDVDHAEEDDERVNCMVQMVLFAPKSENKYQQYISQSSCSINQKVCDLIVRKFCGKEPRGPSDVVNRTASLALQHCVDKEGP